MSVVPQAPPRQPSLLERFGSARLAGWKVGVPRPAEAQAVHLLDDNERRAVRAVERAVVARAALLGASSALLSALAEIAAQSWEHSAPWRFWLVVGVVTVVASILEITALSWDALRSVARLADAAGIRVDDERERAAVVASLARAALEVPEPMVSSLGVNPLRETPRWTVVLAALVYKLKVSATNIVLKLVLRRAMGRAAVRAWLPLVSIPGTALWNALVCLRVMRQARLRIFGPSLVADVLRRLPVEPSASLALRQCCVRAVGSCIVRTADLHPNLEALLVGLLGRLDLPIPPDVDDSRRFLESLGALDAPSQRQVLRVLAVAAVIDGRLARGERRLLREASAVAGVPFELAATRGQARRLRAGEPLEI